MSYCIVPVDGGCLCLCGWLLLVVWHYYFIMVRKTIIVGAAPEEVLWNDVLSVCYRYGTESMAILFVTKREISKSRRLLCLAGTKQDKYNFRSVTQHLSTQCKKCRSMAKRTAPTTKHSTIQQWNKQCTVVE